MLPVPCAPLLQMESLFGSLPEMLDFQRVFLQTLEEKIASSPDCSTLETPAQFKVRHILRLGSGGRIQSELVSFFVCGCGADK